MASRVTVKISGPAFRVTAYVVNSKILKKLQSATEDDALYEDEPLSIVGNIALRAIRVANGFCIDNVDDFKFEVQIDGEFQEVFKSWFNRQGKSREGGYTIYRRGTC